MEEQTSLQKLLSFVIIFGLMGASFILGTRWQEYDHLKNQVKHRALIKEIGASIDRTIISAKGK